MVFYNVVLSSSNSWEYTMCLLALGVGSTKLTEVNATVTYAKTSG